MEHGVYESAGPGGTLHWRERADRHWIARGMGGTFDAAPLRAGGYQLYWLPDGGHFVDLGPHPTLGGAWQTARFYADGTLTGRAAEAPAAQAAEVGGCAHTHPPDVATTPCATPAAPEGPVVVDHKEVTASQTTVVAGESSCLLEWTKIVGFASGKRGSERWKGTPPTGPFVGHLYLIKHKHEKPYEVFFVSGVEEKRLGSLPTLSAAKRKAESHEKASRQFFERQGMFPMPTKVRTRPKAKRGARRQK